MKWTTYRKIRNYISWIDKGEGLIANDVDFNEVDRYVVHMLIYIIVIIIVI